MNRRKFLTRAAGTTGVLLAGGWLLRPSDRGAGGHDAYFQTLSAALREHGLARPTLLVDLDRLDHNIGEVAAGVSPRQYRIVAKSLPSAPLLAHIMDKAQTKRLMVFHEPFLTAAARSHPESDLLVGKPLPVAAADQCYRRLDPGAFDASRQLQWLIDTPERLRQYRELAAGRRLSMRVNIELDVGLHRGGIASPGELTAMLEAIDGDPNVQLGGLMGYDPHVAKMPDLLGLPDREFTRVQERYRGFLAALRAHHPELREDALVLNAAGSPTYQLWRGVDGIANDIAVGSGLLKPVDFDIPTLASHVPGLYIASPVLKTSAGVRIPGLDSVGALQQAWDPNRARTFFVYGGYWKARPVSPPGLSENPIFGRSTNQEMLNGSDEVDLAVDDFVFFRPTQSEFVMLQFGDLAIVRGGKIVDFWAPFPATG
jgi:D-serine deaminase-like pyridoxal phosphate-dependent protein